MYGEDDVFIADVQGMVWSSQGVSGTWQQLADKAGLSCSTVRNFATGTTRRPHARTLEKLLGALGFRLAIVPLNHPMMSGEVDLTAYRKKRA